MPPELAARWVPFDWDNERLWSLDLPVDRLPRSELDGLLDLRVWKDEDGRWFAVRPRDVLLDPDRHPRQRDRVWRADLRWPLDVVRYREQWLILDGFHRLARHTVEGAAFVPIRAVPLDTLRSIGLPASRAKTTEDA